MVTRPPAPLVCPVSRLRLALASTLLAAGLLAACGGHSGSSSAVVDAGTTEVEGTINGISLVHAYAVAIPDNSNANNPPTNQYTRLALGIANRPLTCDTGGIPNGTILTFSIITPGQAPVGPGAYEINTNSASAVDNVAALITTDATCAASSPASVVGGTVRITEATDSVIAGSFSLAFDSGEALQGTFAAATCTAIPPSLRGVGC
jgi:hypothetical protein